jgi:hypothetical protein
MTINSPYTLVKVKSQKNYPGYTHRQEIIDDSEHGGKGKLEMACCYSADTGDYIGDVQMAKLICKEYGMRLVQKAKKDHSVCSIGFNEGEQKWYGWSHRAIYGFGVGSVCKKGDCGYIPIDKDDFLEDIVRFWSDENHINVKGEHQVQENEDGREESGVYVEWEYSDETPNERLRQTIGGIFNIYPDRYGKGKWKARTMEDAKQMAIDFAAGVS